MNTRGIRTLTMLSLLLATAQASAIPILVSFSPRLTQDRVTQGELTAGLIVAAETNLSNLVIAGGFTITCSTNTALPHQVQDAKPFYNFWGGISEVLRLPPQSNGWGIYRIPDWTAMPPASCGRSCTGNFKAEILDGSSLSPIEFRHEGVGFSISLIPTGQRAPMDSINVEVCRGGTPTCCNCQIP